MSQLQEALSQIAQGPKAVRAWLERNPSALKPEFLAEVKQYAMEATQHGAGNAALAAHLLAGSIQMQNGDLEGVLQSQLNQAEVMFMMAETTEGYEHPHNIAISVADKAMQMSLDKNLFWAIGLAADSAYFGSEAAQDRATKDQWLLTSVDTLFRLEQITPPKDAPGSWQRFVSGLVAIYQTITQHKWQPDISMMEPKLRRLAALAEKLIPIPFNFSDPEKTKHVALHLAELSTNYGSAAAAEARLKGSYQAKKSEKWDEG